MCCPVYSVKKDVYEKTKRKSGEIIVAKEDDH